MLLCRTHLIPVQRPAFWQLAAAGLGSVWGHACSTWQSTLLTRTLEKAEICLMIDVLHRKDSCSNEKEPSISQKWDCISTKTEKMGVCGRTLEQMEWLILFLSSPCIFRA